MMPPGKRAPQAAEAADDHRLERVEQPRRADGRIEIGAHAEIERGDRRSPPWRCPSRAQKMRLVVDAHQLRDFEIVGGRAEGAAERGAIEDAD